MSLENNQNHEIKRDIILAGKSYNPLEVPVGVVLNPMGEICLTKEDSDYYYRFAIDVLNNPGQRFAIENLDPREIFLLKAHFTIIRNEAKLRENILQYRLEALSVTDELLQATSIHDIVSILETYTRMFTPEIIQQLRDSGDSVNPEDYREDFGLREALKRITQVP